MYKKRSRKQGFTLIEMLIAMSIFVIFMGVIMNSYLGIIKSQREANQYRVIYSEARHIFDKFTDSVRNGAVYYGEKNIGFVNDPDNKITIVSSDAGKVVSFEQSGSDVYYSEAEKDQATSNYSNWKSYKLNSDQIQIKDFKVFVSPKFDPYLTDNVADDQLQFQPKVTLFAEFSKDFGEGRVFNVDLQTTVSSRNYAPAYNGQISVPAPVISTDLSDLSNE